MMGLEKEEVKRIINVSSSIKKLSWIDKNLPSFFLEQNVQVEIEPIAKRKASLELF